MFKQSVEELCSLGNQALTAGDRQSAKAFFARALLVRTDWPDAHYGLALVYFLLDESAQAAFHFREVTRLDPSRAGAFINLGAIYNRLGEFDAAAAVLQKGIQLDRNVAEGYYNLGLVYKRRDKLDLATEAYKQALQVNPQMADAHLNLGNIYLKQQHYRLALSHFKKAVEIRPQWEKARRNLKIAQARHDAEARGSLTHEKSEEAHDTSMDLVPLDPLALETAPTPADSEISLAENQQTEDLAPIKLRRDEEEIVSSAQRPNDTTLSHRKTRANLDRDRTPTPADSEMAVPNKPQANQEANPSKPGPKNRSAKASPQAGRSKPAGPKSQEQKTQGDSRNEGASKRSRTQPKTTVGGTNPDGSAKRKKTELPSDEKKKTELHAKSAPPAGKKAEKKIAEKGQPAAKNQQEKVESPREKVEGPKDKKEPPERKVEPPKRVESPPPRKVMEHPKPPKVGPPSHEAPRKPYPTPNRFYEAAKSNTKGPREYTSIDKDPPMGNTFGCGFALLGEFDDDSESHIKILCLMILFIPVLALRAYRVSNHKGRVLGRTSFRLPMIIWNVVALALIGGLGSYVYSLSPKPKTALTTSAKKQIEVAHRELIEALDKDADQDRLKQMLIKVSDATERVKEEEMKKFIKTEEMKVLKKRLSKAWHDWTQRRIKEGPKEQN